MSSKRTSRTTGKATLAPIFGWEHALSRDIELTASTRHVGLTIALFMSRETATCWPSVNTLAERTGLSTRTIKRATAALIEGGWLDVERGGHGKGDSNVYHARTPAGRIVAITDDTLVNVASSEERHHVTLSDQRVVTQTSSTDLVGRTQVVGGEGLELAPSETTPKSDRPPDLLFEAVADATGIDWHELTPSLRGAMNRAVSDIRSVGGTPAEVHLRAQVYPLHFPDAALTPSSLAKWWSKLGNVPRREGRVTRLQRLAGEVHGGSNGSTRALGTASDSVRR